MPRTLRVSVKVRQLYALGTLAHKLIGADHLLCLNRGTADSGSEWIERTLLQLDATLIAAQGGKEDDGAPARIPLHIWWGWQDSMVPRKGQCEQDCR